MRQSDDLWKEIAFVIRYGRQPLSEILGWPYHWLDRVASLLSDQNKELNAASEKN